jgi:hypothetical protein
VQNSPLESSCVIVTVIENYSTSKPLKSSPEKSHILSCDTLVANGRYILLIIEHNWEVSPEEGYLCKDACAFCISLCFRLRMRNVSDESCTGVLISI